ncbi:hypothetical protein TrRE_jg7728, partial [Triparma retinervis]
TPRHSSPTGPQFAIWDADHSNTISEDEYIKFCKELLDNNQRHEVVFKFMKNKDQFDREIDAREKNELDSKFVVGVNRTYDGSTDEVFLSALEQANLGEYKFAVVMPCADRNLDTIFRSERPDMTTLIHGDIKFLNVVRFSSRLRLIDLDASAPLCTDSTVFYAGAKFSSGVLPPEMIHTLKGDDLKTFETYFADVMKSDPELWDKIQPKVFKKGRKKEKYVVKTFLTTSIADSDGDIIEQPRSHSPLPYQLVRSSPSLDIWSFGTILYALCTGSPLFNVNRDDDLKEALDMHEVATWDDAKKIKSLAEINDPMAKDLLSKLLSRDPDDRPGTFQDVLNHSFFTMEGEGDDDDSIAARAKEILDKAEDFMDNVTNLTETTSSFISDPASFAMNFGSSMFKGKMKEMKSKMVDKEMYMYLVDEFTNEPVFDHSGLYPKVIETKSDLVDQHMPMMRVGLQAMAVMNGAAGLASCFCPGIPNRLVPKGLMEKATKFVDGLDKESNVADYDVVQGEVERQGEGSSGAKRGGELREYENFLMEHDPEGAFANLIRVCDQGSGRAIWVTKESAAEIEGKAGGGGGGGAPVGSAEMKRLEEENAKLLKEELQRQLEIKKLEEKNMELMEKLKEVHLSSGESSVSSGGEKNLSSAEHGLSAATALKLEMSIKRGELLKKSKYLGKWQLRSITLTSDGLFSWLGGGSKHSGHVYLTVNSLASIEESEGGEGERWPFTLITEERKILFATKTMEERKEWCEAITKFCSS